ncbi:MAG: acyltransferase [Bacteroidales bacterium]|nr:acyltransferase [Bacteroidales bacterium]
MDIKTIEQQIFTVANNVDFDSAAVEVFNYQYRTNPVYNQYVNYLGISPERVESVHKIPFLPIQFFKTHTVLSGCGIEDCPECFTSSGTTGQNTSRHYVKDPEIYFRSLEIGFRQFYGSPDNYTILALLPSYLERKGSSLIVMAQRLMQLSGQKEEGFFLYDFNALQQRINQEIASGKKVLLIGVTFALLDFAEQYPQHYGDNVIIMETGGMKGRKKEIIRQEVHQILTSQLGVNAIHSEYGMTELLSQAYSSGGGLYRETSTMKIIIRDSTDPLSTTPDTTAGCINVIDLANIHSCSFIETQDLGIRHQDGTFEVLGRNDHSDIRGCNLMYAG